MSSLAAIFGNSPDKSQDSEKLLDLYWNRAALKKKFAGMRKEQFRLQDKIKQQEGIAARLQQKLNHLEELLVDPASERPQIQKLSIQSRIDTVSLAIIRAE